MKIGWEINYVGKAMSVSICKRESPNDGINPWSSLLRKGSRNTARHSTLSHMLSRTRPTSIYVRQLVTGHYCRLEVTSRELYCRYRRPLQSVILVRNAGDRSAFLSDTCKNMDTEGALYIAMACNSKSLAAWSFQ